jgi:hypothetical protein
MPGREKIILYVSDSLLDKKIERGRGKIWFFEN